MEDDEEGGFSGVLVLFVRGGGGLFENVEGGVSGLLGDGVNWGAKPLEDEEEEEGDFFVVAGLGEEAGSVVPRMWCSPVGQGRDDRHEH